MDEFLRKIQLSEYAIEIYLNSLGTFPLTYYELYSIVPKASQEEFDASLNELLKTGLLIQQGSKKQGTVIQYLPIPPLLPILNYYENIEVNLTHIKNSIQELMINSVNTIFQENKTINLDSILNTFQEFKKDIDEDSIIQKQEVEDIVESMEELKNIKKKVSDLHQNVKKLAQTKLTDILKNLKSEIVRNIDSLEFKKHKNEILSLIEKNFKKEIIGDLTKKLHEVIEKEFENAFKPIDNTTDSIFQYRNDFKMLLLNMLNNFETHMNKIYELLKENKESIFDAMKNLENKIAENLNAVIQNSINEVSNLNKPVENVLRNYLQEISVSDKSIIKNVWTIRSVTKINEEIQNLIITSKENLTIIIPHIENHIAIEQFDKIASNLKVKITSSEAHTNSIVKNFKDIKNVIYRTYQNDNLIALSSDNQQFLMGIIQVSDDPLNDFIGFGSTSKSLIKLLEPLLMNIWENAYSDTFHATQMAKTQPSKPVTFKTLTTAKPIITGKIQSEEVKKIPKIIEKEKPTITIPGHIQDIPKSDKRSTKSPTKFTHSQTVPKPQVTDLKQKLKEKIDFLSAAQPQADDEAGIQINTAFTFLIQKLDTLKGDEFGKELQNIADLILEKKGFSVTLHKVRSTINKYKDKFTLLGANDKKEIIENIKSWKQRLF